jgi:light-regulated signal transduction histidine kinase (bacteriophytochrome)
MSEDAVLAAWRLRSLQVGAAVLLLAALLAFLMFRLRRADAELLCLNAGLERRVKERTSDLERINRELEAFAYTISHDLRTPLRGIAGYARILEEDYAAKLDGPGHSILQRVQVTARRMGELIEDMLNLSRVSRAELRLETVDLAALARVTVDQLRAADPRRSVHFEIPAALNVRGDRALLAVVMANLVGNAWKFTGKRASARIEVGVTAAAGGPAYFVRDDGAGFDMQYAGNLFKQFHRLHDEREFPGNGIGLATVQRVVERHGGRVWADAVAGKGACFYFTLPNQDKP